MCLLITVTISVKTVFRQGPFDIWGGGGDKFWRISNQFIAVAGYRIS